MGLGSVVGAAPTIVALTAAAAPAQATIREGVVSDPAGDATGGPAFDIVAVAGWADDAGAAALTISTQAAATANVWLLGVVGTRSGDGCDAPFAAFLGDPAHGVASFSTGSSSGARAAQIKVDQNTVTLSAQDSELAVAYNCAVAYALPAGSADPSLARDTTDTIADLVADAAPPPAPPPATPPPPTKSATPPVAVPKTAKLTLTLGGAPSTIRRNRTIRLKLGIANDGSKKSGRVTVTFGKAGGLSGVRKAKKLAALKPAQRRTLTLKVKLTRRARTSTTLRVSAKAGKLKATSSLLLRIGKAKKPAARAKKSPIVGTYWWRTVTHADSAWDNRALYFVDGASVYSGFPKGGLPATCTTPPAEPAEEIDTREGCLPYTFDKRTGAVTIGDKAGTFQGGKLTIDGNTYTRLTRAAPSQRFTINQHEHVSFSGLCGLILGCTVTQQFLSLLPDGQFVLSRSTTASQGDPGVGGYVFAGSFPPDQHGTYEVQANGAIKLSYADGSVKVETFAIDANDAGAPDPVGAGVLVGEDNFYPDPSP